MLALQHGAISGRRAAQAFMCCTCAVSHWERAATEELEGTIGLEALDVLRITSRSRHNRTVLLQLGVLPGLAHLMKVTFHSLRADIAMVSLDSSEQDSLEVEHGTVRDNSSRGILLELI